LRWDIRNSFALYLVIPAKAGIQLDPFSGLLDDQDGFPRARE
jgi:hypothetical protein